MNIVIFGLSVTSSWGNGHATTFRALIKGLVARGHEVVFLERDVPWYATQRDLRSIPGAEIHLYSTLPGLRRRFRDLVSRADLVIVGSYVPDGVVLGEWVLRTARGVTAFYDIDTPVTLASLATDSCPYLRAGMIAEYALYLSFSGGPTLDRLELVHGSPCARALYCGVDPDRHRPVEVERTWDLGYLGTYAADRQPALEHMLLGAAQSMPRGRFAVAGAQYPKSMRWPGNVTRLEHIAPEEHRRFYCEQRFTLNLTRAAMIEAGHSPSVRLFEAAACGTAIITDAWAGLDTVFEPGREIVVASRLADVLHALRDLTEAEVQAIGGAARARVLASHTGEHRARELERHVRDVVRGRSAPAAATTHQRRELCSKRIA